MSFGPPRRRPQKPTRTGKSAEPDLERKQELRQLAHDRQSAWMVKKEPFSLDAVRAASSHAQQELLKHLNNSAGAADFGVESGTILRPASERRRRAYGDVSQSNVFDKDQDRCDLNRLAELAVYTAKSEAHQLGREDRPESHFCRQCHKLMSLSGHNAMCLIPCAHTLCESCCTKSLERCPICGLTVRTSTFNVLLQKIIDRFSEEHGLVKDSTSHNYGGEAAPQGPSLEEVAGAADYVPSSETINRWAEQLASVEMRLSVVDVQARELAKELITYKTRVQSHLSDIQKTEAEEERILKQLAVLSDELEIVRKQKEKCMESARLEKANADKVGEQLNLTNYTKAGLEAEVEKLRLLCNRKS